LKSKKTSTGIKEERDTEKPKCRLIGKDGNVFNIIGLVTQALERAGRKKEAEEFTDWAFIARSYDEVLILCSEYVDIE